jgi:sodium transport system permease protein
MTSRIGTVFRKEVLDNFRDRRSLMSALFFGPLFGPFLFSIMISFALDKHVSEIDDPLQLPVAGAENAPNLITFLERANAEIVPTDVDLDSAREKVSNGELDLVLIIPPTFAEQFSAGQPAVAQLVSDSANNNTTKAARRAGKLLDAYQRKLGMMRLQARGLHPTAMLPVVVEDIDVSTPTGRSVILLGMMTYFVIFSMLMGGMYLAIDTTAGERERGSLEPLLTLPVERSQLIIGKILATCVYMVTSLAVTLLAFSVSLRLVPLEELGMTANFGPAVVLRVFVLMLPFALLGASLMTCVASFTKSYKEAQTYLTVVMLVPTLPIMFAAIKTVKPDLSYMMVPSLSQHLIITDLMKAEPIPLAYPLVSIGSTLLLGILLAALAARLYRREGILG